MVVPPPAMKTLPVSSSVAVWLARGVLIDMVGAHAGSTSTRSPRPSTWSSIRSPCTASLTVTGRPLAAWARGRRHPQPRQIRLVAQLHEVAVLRRRGALDLPRRHGPIGEGRALVEQQPLLQPLVGRAPVGCAARPRVRDRTPRQRALSRRADLPHARLEPARRPEADHALAAPGQRRSQPNVDRVDARHEPLALRGEGPRRAQDLGGLHREARSQRLRRIGARRATAAERAGEHADGGEQPKSRGRTGEGHDAGARPPSLLLNLAKRNPTMPARSRCPPRCGSPPDAR